MEEEQGLIYNIKLSSVGPGNLTIPTDTVVDPGNMDMAMKLHYLRGVYYFEGPAFEGLTTMAVKEPMFLWLNRHPVTCGRFRRTESGRAQIKCNDCGVRFVEAECKYALREWLEMEDVTRGEKLLCSDHCIGPELSFSPLVYLTKFKCGAAAVGLNWAHVLGDAFSAAEYMNSLGQIVAKLGPGQPINLAHALTKPKNYGMLPKVVKEPLSIKRVGPVGDNWVHVTKSKMEAFSFDVSPMQLIHLQEKLDTIGTDFSPFEAILAVVWKCIANVRGEASEPRVVTICKRSEPNDIYVHNTRNGQVVSVVVADFHVGSADPSELATLVKNDALDERRMIEEAMESDHGLADYVVYGANLTFVNLEEAKLYDFEYRGQKPVSVSYMIDGVGEEGVVMVLPIKKGGGTNGGGRSVTAILPEIEIVGLKSVLRKEGLIA